MPSKIGTILGARPQIVKAGPVMRAVQEHNRKHQESVIQEILSIPVNIMTTRCPGVFFEDLGLKEPDYHLGVGSGSHGAQTGEMLKRTEEVLVKERPDFVLVYGDTNSTQAGALAAAKVQISVAHVEAGLPVVLPLHPRTHKAVEALGLFPNGVRVLEPVSYLDMLLLEKNARVILTDSGGVQKEAFFFQVPCVTLRGETKWVETVEAGWNVLVGCDPERIIQAALDARPGMESACPYGDGRAAERIVGVLTNGEGQCL